MPTSRQTFPEQIARDYDRIATEGIPFPTARLCDDHIIQALPATCALIVDAGCGTGGLTKRLVEVADRVLAIDVSPKSLEVAQGEVAGSNVEFCRARAEDLAAMVPASGCSAIIANRVLHHCSNLPVLLQSLVELLEPGGRLIIVDLDSTGGTSGRLKRLRSALFYNTSVVVKAIFRWRLRHALRDLRQECLAYRSGPWQQHLAHEPDFSWRSIRDALAEMSSVRVTHKRINWRFHLIVAERKSGVKTEVKQGFCAGFSIIPEKSGPEPDDDGIPEYKMFLV